MSNISILIPTKNRSVALAATLTSILSQTYTNFIVIISDQSTFYDVEKLPTFRTLQRIFQEHGKQILFLKNMPSKGMAQQRQFLLENSHTPYSMFLDDDCILEPFVIKNLVDTIEHQCCGFVGQAVIGLSFRNDIRPKQQNIEFWSGRVTPEVIQPSSPKWQRHLLHNAANVFHVQEKLHIHSDHPRAYKIAWVGGCVLYDTEKLLHAGGFSFWKDLPKEHAGEDVLAQLHVMEEYGGCAILPSGVYHQELETTIPNRKTNAPDYLYTSL